MDRTVHGLTRRAVLSALGASGLTALAGCSGGDQSATPDTVTTESPTETSPPQQTATAETMELPPGTSEDGIDDASALVSATQSALRATDYAIESVIPLGETATATVTIRSSLAQERHLYVLDAPSETNRRYVADGTSHLQATADGETTYTSEAVDDFTAVHEDTDQIRMLGSVETLGGLLRTGSYAPDGTVTRDGRRLHRFALESADLYNDATVVTGEGGAFVDGDGVVFGANIPYTPEGTETTVDWSFAVRTLGDVSVSEPDWVRSE